MSLSSWAFYVCAACYLFSLHASHQSILNVKSSMLRGHRVESQSRAQPQERRSLEETNVFEMPLASYTEPSSLGLPMLLTVIGLAAFWSSGTSNESKRLLFTGIFLLAYMYNAAFYVIHSVTGHGLDESFFYHMERGFAGAATGQHQDVIVHGVAAFLLGLAIAGVTLRCAPCRTKASCVRQTIAVLAFLATLLVHPLSRDLAQHYAHASHTQSLTLHERTAFQQVYHDPKQLLQDFHPTKNLVYVYLESLERTYLDPQLFPGVAPRLAQWEQQRAVSFTNITQAGATGWTIAGILASQCGIPLVTTGGSGNSLAAVQDFLPGATCLTDLLHSKGYHQSFVGGADLDFAGKRNFLQTHGIDTLLGKKELLQLHPNELSTQPWGIYDDGLLDLAFDQFLNLSSSSAKQHQPFALYTLTLDTHGDKPSPSCLENKVSLGDNTVLDSVRCADFLVDRFLQRILDSDYAQDTLIVVASDHLAMPYAQDVTRIDPSKRRNTFFVLNADTDTDTPRHYDTPGTTLDIPATLLPFLSTGTTGTTTAQRGFGLGRDLRNGHTLQSLDPNFAKQGWKQYIPNLKEFWNLRDLLGLFQSTLRIDDRRNRIQLGGQDYFIPIVVRATAEGQIEEMVFTSFQENMNRIGAVDAAHAESTSTSSNTTTTGSNSFTAGITLAIDRCHRFHSNEQLESYRWNNCLFVHNHARSPQGQVQCLNYTEGLVDIDLMTLLNATQPVPGFVPATLKYNHQAVQALRKISNSQI